VEVFSAVIDLFDKSVVGWVLAVNVKKELVIDAVGNGDTAQEISKGLIAHSDRGSQCCSYAD
jgi:transposase InsO family protein